MKDVLVLWIFVITIVNYCPDIGNSFPTDVPFPSGIIPKFKNVDVDFVPNQKLFPKGPITSYEPPPSGAVSTISDAPYIKPLPPLLPSSVIKQLMYALPSRALTPPLLPPVPTISPKSSSSSTSLPSSTFRPLEAIKLSPDPEPYLPAVNVNITSKNIALNTIPFSSDLKQKGNTRTDFPLYTTFKMRNEKFSEISNPTIYAAGILSSLLKNDDVFSNGNPTLREIDASSIDENSLNKTDVIIIRSEKRAYLVPTHDDGGETLSVEEIYEKKDNLPTAYTVNQFLFIIKPKHVNFLNKLS